MTFLFVPLGSDALRSPVHSRPVPRGGSPDSGDTRVVTLAQFGEAETMGNTSRRDS